MSPCKDEIEARGVKALAINNESYHCIGKERTQRLERTNGIVRQQTGRWRRRQNKFGKQK